MLKKVASYGKQLGRIEDALAVVLEVLGDQLRTNDKASAAIDAFTRMVGEIAAVKADQ